MKRALLIASLVMLVACSGEPPEPTLGEQVFNGTCKVCHAQGINGAPILGNKKMWSSRLGQGKETLVKHASEGFGLMPAKGGNNELSEQEIAAAVGFMISRVQ